MKLLFCASFFFMLLASSACTYQYSAALSKDGLEKVGLRDQLKIERQAYWQVHQNSPVYLAHPNNLKQKPHPRHLLALYNSLDSALKQTFPDYHSSMEASSLTKALQLAKSHQSELLFWPRLVSVKDKLNSRQELQEGQAVNPDKEYGFDRSVFQVVIYEVRTERLLDVATIKGRARFFAPDDSGPMDLFDDAAKYYVQAITGKG